jgi:hypothetical protein
MNTKVIQICLFWSPLVFFGVSEAATEKPTSSNLIHVEFAGLPDGLEITAIWQPTGPHLCGDGSVTGNAFLEIRQISSELVSELVVSNISFLNQFVDGSYTDNVDWEKLNSIKTLNINLASYKAAYKEQYALSDDEYLILSEAPISFADLNYDGLDELIVRQSCNGQRYIDTFKVFEFGQFRLLKDELYNITYQEPYKSLDEFSQVNLSKGEIKHLGSGGACNSNYLTYKIAQWAANWISPYEPYLFETTRMEAEDGLLGPEIVEVGCVHRTYTAEKIARECPTFCV